MEDCKTQQSQSVDIARSSPTTGAIRKPYGCHINPDKYEGLISLACKVQRWEVEAAKCDLSAKRYLTVPQFQTLKMMEQRSIISYRVEKELEQKRKQLQMNGADITIEATVYDCDSMMI